MTQAKLGEYLHMDHSLISGYENGKLKPTFDTMIRYLRYFGVDPNYLLGWSKKPLEVKEEDDNDDDDEDEGYDDCDDYDDYDDDLLR